MSGTIDLVAPGAITEAADGLEQVAMRTPLLDTPWLDGSAYAAEVRLKAECLQRTGSFKFRGAFTMIRHLSAAQRERGVITYSSGNHGQAVSLAARLFGTRALVVMPTTAARVKVDGARRWGATVILEGTMSSERQAHAEGIAAEDGYTIIPPYDHADVIAGQGTVGRELLNDWPDVDAVLVPVGGGGQLSGVAAWVKRAKPSCLVIGVEPEGSDVVRRSLQAGKPVLLPGAKTIADGLRSDRTGDVVFAHIKELVDDVVTVDDAAIARTTGLLLRDARIVVEYSGAVALAALLAGRWQGREHRVGVVISGGNIDPSVATSLLEPPERATDVPVDQPVASRR